MKLSKPLQVIPERHSEQGSWELINIQSLGLIYFSILKKLFIVLISPWNKGFFNSLFTPVTIVE